MADRLSGAESDALDYLYGGDRDVEIVCHSAAWVTTRFPQGCFSCLHKGNHTLPARSRMVLERARVDGRFGSSYTCETCIKAAIKELANG